MTSWQFSGSQSILMLTIMVGILALAPAGAEEVSPGQAASSQLPTEAKTQLLSNLELSQLLLASARQWEKEDPNSLSPAAAQTRALAAALNSQAQAEGVALAPTDVADCLLDVARQRVEQGQLAHVPLMLDVAINLVPQNRELVYQAALLRQEVPWDKRWPGHAIARVETEMESEPQATSTSKGAASSQNVDAPYAPQRKQAEIHGLVVLSRAKNTLGGYVGEIIATRQARDSAAAPTRVDVNGKVDKTMRISLDEALRLALLRLPEGASKGQMVTMSFDDKYGAKAGPSGGTAFTLALLSVLGTLEIDPKAAFTGDITVDGEVRPVGGVGHKITGAQKGGMELVAVPIKNATAAQALAIMQGPSILAKIQIFSAATIDQAEEVANLKRAGKTGDAITRFRALQPKLLDVSSLNAALKSSDVRQELKAISELAPNHLSAKYLLQVSEGRLAQRMSLYDSLEYIMERVSPVLSAFYSGDASAARVGHGYYIMVQKRNYAFAIEELDRINRELQQMEGKVSTKAVPLLTASSRLIMRVRGFLRRYKQIPHFSGYGGYIQRFKVDQARVQALRSVGLQFKEFSETSRSIRNDREYIDAIN